MSTVVYSAAQIHELLSAVSKNFHLPYDKVLECAHTVLRPTSTANKPTLTIKTKSSPPCIEGDLDLCHALVLKSKGKLQCSRTKKKGSLCTTHYKEWEESGKVRGGLVSNSPLYALENNERAVDEHEVTQPDNTTPPPFPFHVELITLNRIDYLYDRVTRYVYDFDTHKHVGKLQDNGTLVVCVITP